NPHAERSVRKHLLRFGGSGKRGRRGGERDEEGVALRIYLDPVVANEDLTQCAAMLGQRGCVGIGADLLQEPRRPLDVGEDKRDRSDRKLARHPAIQARPNARCRISGNRRLNESLIRLIAPDSGTISVSITAQAPRRQSRASSQVLVNPMSVVV